MSKRKALFLDRDGVINSDRGTYTFRPEDFELLPEVAEVIFAMQQRGYLPIIITNQGGIAKGIYTKADVEKTHNYMRSLLRDKGVEIFDIFFSPHHDVIGNSLDRKPGSLMFERAMALHNIDMAASIMIGDSERDIIASNAAGVVHGYLIEQNSSIEFILNEDL